MPAIDRRAGPQAAFSFIEGQAGDLGVRYCVRGRFHQFFIRQKSATVYVR
jgi:hypothetical protein